MKTILIQALFVGLIVAAMLIATGCSHSALVKDCAQVEDQEYYKCKTLKPWE